MYDFQRWLIALGVAVIQTNPDEWVEENIFYSDWQADILDTLGLDWKATQ